MAEGDELLIVDGHPGHREGMRRLFTDRGYHCTALDSIAAARGLVAEKFFPAALIDLDVDQPGGGLDLARILHERSPQTAIVILTARRSFEAAVEALRLGVLDVVKKRPESVPRLQSVVEIACDRYRATQGGELLWDVQAVLDDAFNVMMSMARTHYEPSVGSGTGYRPRVLLVDPDPAMVDAVRRGMADEPWDLQVEVAGGAALDVASGARFDVVAARQELPDLRGSMVVRSLQAIHAECVGFVYTEPGAEGRLERYHAGRAEDVERPFKGPAHVVRRVRQAVDALGRTERDRRIIRAFRADHEAFFRRYAELKLRIGRLVE